MPRFFLILLVILLMAAAVPATHAQIMLQPESVDSDTVVVAYIPAVAYASDLGLLGGVIVNRYRYHPRTLPYVSLTEVKLQASTQGFFDTRIRYEWTNLFGRSIRSRWTLYGERNPYDNYFGIGNTTTFDSDAWADDFYFYDARRMGLEWLVRKAVYKPVSRDGQLEIMANVKTGFEVPQEDSEQLMSQDRPIGFDGGWIHSFGLGLLWEKRDNEFSATRGNRFELFADWAPGGFLGDFAMVSVFSEYRHFVTIPIPYFRPVLAARVAGEWASGTIPYWKRPYLGDQMTLRGYPTYRFRGDASFFYNIELRTWIYEYPFLDFKFGIHGFHDAGRVLYEDDGFKQLFYDNHRTFGGGVATTLFTPDFILRIDVGVSEEMYRLYMNVGYMF